jgi:hypothetical protein
MKTPVFSKRPYAAGPRDCQLFARHCFGVGRSMMAMALL